MDEGLTESLNWGWGLSLIALSIAIHTMGVVMMAFAAARLRPRVEARKRRGGHVIPIVVAVVGLTGILLAVLHGIEAAIWAAAYLWVGALDSSTKAMLYSVDAMSTRGASGVTLLEHWQMMGALEAVAGMLLFGISTAYIFSVMIAYWHMLNPETESGFRPVASERVPSDGRG